MRYLLLFLLLPGIVLAVDVKRVGTHTIDGNLTDTVEYIEYYFGDYANSTKAVIDSYSDETDYVESRSGPLIISRWSIRSSNDSLSISVKGVYPGFVVEENGRYKIDGKGFIDELCTKYMYSRIPAIDQEFDFTIVVPENLRILSVPENSSKDLTAVFYNLTVSSYGNIVNRNTRLIVKNSTDIYTYCDERDELDKILKQGIIAEKATDIDRGNLPWVLFLLTLLVLSLLYLVKK